MHATGPVERLAVRGDGSDVTSQAGTHLLGRIAQQLGIAEGAAAAMADTVTRSSAHDRGRLVTQVAMMIAAGGRSLSDLKTLRDQPALFGVVASDATVWRAMHQVDEPHLGALVGVRQQACRRLLEQIDEPLVLDIDASLVASASDFKQGAAANFKGGFGFHPMLCFIAARAGRGDAATRQRHANTTADQVAVLDQAIGSLPEVWQTGRRPFAIPGQKQRLADVALRVLREDPPRIGGSVPAGLEDAIRCAMARQADDRPSAAAALGRRLQELQEELGQTRTPLAAAESPAPVEEASSPSRTRVLVSTGAGVVVVAGLVLAGVLGTRGAGDTLPTPTASPTEVVATDAILPPPVPRDVTLERTDGGVRVTWDGVADDVTWQVRRVDEGYGDRPPLQVEGDPVAVLRGVEEDARPCVQVRAVNAAGQTSRPSEVVCT